MPTYLVESYSSAGRMKELEATLARLQGSLDGVRHVRTTLVPEDEMCLHFVEGPSMEAVGAAFRRAAIPFERITDVTERPGDADSSGVGSNRPTVGDGSQEPLPSNVDDPLRSKERS